MPSPDTMWEAVRRYENAGFSAGFSVHPAGRLLCQACRKESDAKDVAMLALHRFEGESDPGDEAAVAALECPACRSRGTLVLTYGPTAPVEDRLVLNRLKDLRSANAAGLRPGL
jgi:hypothetical protein